MLAAPRFDDCEVHMVRVVRLVLALAMATGTAATAQTGAGRSMSMSGFVKGVSASTLTVESGGREVVFAIVPSTRFIGRSGPSDLVLRTPEERMRRLLSSIKPDDRVTVV